MEKERTAQEERAKILVVDDDFIIRQFIATLLLSSGYTCVCVEDGVAAVKMLETTSFDMVISDIEMPRLNGFELLAHVKKKYPDLKFILISGKYRPDDTATGLSTNDAHHFLSKPFPVNDFLSTITTILQQP